jgi:predicted component of type VI protein secretion system
MTTTEALIIIDSLANGRCPITGQLLDGTYQQPDVVQALFLAINALERIERLDQKRAVLPEGAGRAWDAAEEQRLCEEFDSGKSVREIAEIHQRTNGAIQARLNRLGRLRANSAENGMQ